MLYNMKAPGPKIEGVFSDTMDMLIAKEYKRPETIAGLLLILAIQIIGVTPEAEQFDAYVKAISEYTVLFFGDDYKEGDPVH